MGTHASTLPPFRLPLAPLSPRVVSEWASTRDRRRWPRPAFGDGRPVMLIPGFLAGDASLTRMAVWLRTGGYALARSGINRNTSCMEEAVAKLTVRLEHAVQRSGRPALVIGQSRGGSMGRALTALRPDLVQTLVTLGSPLLDQLAVAPHVWPSIGAIGLLGTLGVPGMFSLSCFRGTCCARIQAAITGPFPDGVQFISVYSRSDEVVRWRACLDPAASLVEVHASHVGMGMARDVWTALATALGTEPS